MRLLLFLALTLMGSFAGAAEEKCPFEVLRASLDEVSRRLEGLPGLPADLNRLARFRALLDSLQELRPNFDQLHGWERDLAGGKISPKDLLPEATKALEGAVNEATKHFEQLPAGGARDELEGWLVLSHRLQALCRNAVDKEMQQAQNPQPANGQGESRENPGQANGSASGQAADGAAGQPGQGSGEAQASSPSNAQAGEGQGQGEGAGQPGGQGNAQAGNGEPSAGTAQASGGNPQGQTQVSDPGASPPDSSGSPSPAPNNLSALQSALSGLDQAPRLPEPSTPAHETEIDPGNQIANQSGGKEAGKDDKYSTRVAPSLLESLDTIRQSAPDPTIAPDAAENALVPSPARELTERLEPDRQYPIPDLDDLRREEIAAQAVRALWDSAWITSLSQYENELRLVSGLQAYSAMAKAANEQEPEYVFSKQYAARAERLGRLIEAAQSGHESLHELGLKLVTDRPTLSRRLRLISRVFSELESQRSLTPSESRALTLSRRLLAQLHSSHASDPDAALGNAFLAQLTGPLSLAELQKRYPVTRTDRRSALPAISRALRAHKLDDLLVLPNASPYLNLFRQMVRKPRTVTDFTGPQVPFSEGEPDTALTEDLQQFPSFQRRGLPPNLDLIQLASGSMLQNIFNDESEKDDPTAFQPAFVDIMVFDVSGSMAAWKEERRVKTGPAKYMARNILASAFVDRVQSEVALGYGTHEFCGIAFGAKVYKPEWVRHMEQAQNYFDRMMQEPPGGDNGTDITLALTKALNQVENHNGANILLVTDGLDDKFDPQTLHQLLDQLAARGVQVNISLVLLGVENPDLKKFVLDRAHKGGAHLAYHYLSFDDMETLMSPEASLAVLEEVAEDYGEPDGEFSLSDLSFLQQALTRIEAQREFYKHSDPRETRLTLDRVRHDNRSPLRTLVHEQWRKFLEMAESPLAAQWTDAQRAFMYRHFVRSLASEIGTAETEILRATGPTHRRRLRAFLNKP